MPKKANRRPKTGGADVSAGAVASTPAYHDAPPAGNFLSRPWAKLIVGNLNDPALATLADDAWRFYFEALMIGAEANAGGKLPDLSALAFKARRTEQEAARLLRVLVERGLIVKTRKGLYLARWAAEQPLRTDAERQRKHRFPALAVTLPSRDGHAPDDDDDTTMTRRGRGPDDDDASSSSSASSPIVETLAALCECPRQKATDAAQTIQAEGLGNAESVIAWVRDDWPGIRPSNGRRSAPWPSQVVDGLRSRARGDEIRERGDSSGRQRYADALEAGEDGRI